MWQDKTYATMRTDRPAFWNNYVYHIKFVLFDKVDFAANDFCYERTLNISDFSIAFLTRKELDYIPKTNVKCAIFRLNWILIPLFICLPIPADKFPTAELLQRYQIINSVWIVFGTVILNEYEDYVSKRTLDLTLSKKDIETTFNRLLRFPCKN